MVAITPKMAIFYCTRKKSSAGYFYRLINPRKNLCCKYSCWPIVMNTYNLPPWLCMKRKFMMLTMLISGPQQPDHDIDDYLAPLIDDLKTLWEVGV